MALDTLAIFLLEIVSLSIDDSKSLSNTASTGAGIWGSIFFIIGVVMMFMLVFVKKCSRIWSTYTLVANIVVLIVACILIGLDANTVTPYNTQISSAPAKIKVLKAQLALAILMLILSIVYIELYIYTAFHSLYKVSEAWKIVPYPPYPIIG
ncbi:unnamed protein product [Didymodactylos carnosus]|uniref:Uncharacterized protein n=1 Tax=Didymodactylos carnosus TaxID=1234261 RepID=A0A815YW30_9BILA|nr:unnamed protein product [Didymodactylos carnosus]CAF4440650.1 unnamed protein product [Didymodactylos carnosus]